MPALSREQRKLLEVATLRYMENLDDVAGMLAARGIDLEHARSNGLGVVNDPLPQHYGHKGKLAIPYLTDFGPVNMRFRCLEEHSCKEQPGHGKYMTVKGWPVNLYGVQQLTQAEDWICVTEGELDALVLQQVGLPAVGAPGSEAWREHWPNIFEDFARVYVFTDGDKAGDAMWDRWIHEVSTAIRVKLPSGEDVNSFFLKYGAEALKSKIKK